MKNNRIAEIQEQISLLSAKSDANKDDTIARLEAIIALYEELADLQYEPDF